VQAGRVRVVTFGGPATPREPEDDYIDVTPPRDRRRDP
jgi:hypothetical protein